jgi:signal transduction histidine kinase
VQESAPQLWWIFVAATVLGVVLAASFIASVLIQQRRFLATTRQFAGRLLAAQEEERAWIARELHDDLIQRVAVLGQDLEQLERGREGVAEPVRLAGIREELHDLAGEIRRIAHRMHPAVLDHLGLSAALVQLAAEFEQQGLAVRLESSLPSEAVPAAVATCLYRVAQEALRNIARHAGVSEALVRVVPDRGGVLLEVRDDGAGFDPGSDSARAGLGLTSLTERLHLVQGRLSIHSMPGQGTSIVAWVPALSPT